MLHPLINPNSQHYQHDTKSSIEMMEEKYNVLEMIAFCRINIFKYEYRKEHKGQLDSDLEKITTYKNYLNLLLSCYEEFYIYSPTVKQSYSRNGIAIEYK